MALEGVAGQPPEDETVEFGVVGGRLESKGSFAASQADFDGFCDFGLEIRIADVEGCRCVVAAPGEQFRRLRRTLDILGGRAGGEVPR